MSELFDILNSTIYSFNPPGGMIWSIAFEPLVGALLTEGSANGNDVLGVTASNNGFSKFTPGLFLMQLYPFSSTHLTCMLTDCPPRY